jgi:beta-phosphoglucomutase-like phosphatase (HAD superfamily)
MKVPPRNCLVIEDSTAGVRAGRRAGMRVFGFAGGSHCGNGYRERLLEAGTELVFETMTELPSLLEVAREPVVV